MAIVNGLNGTPPYSYLWSDPTGQTTQTANELDATTYFVTVTDFNGCEIIDTVLVDSPDLISLITTPTNVTCNLGTNGSIFTNTSGGTAPYTVVWATAQTGTAITGLGAGSYSATIMDANGCTTTCTASIAGSSP